nr:GTP-binding protein [Pleurocapsa sp. PCC 7327]
MKGILNFNGEDRRFVFQGLHMLFDGKPDRRWKPTETRKNELVFIGRNLDKAELKGKFRACLV